MPRNGSGLYSLPAGNPVVTGTIISSTTHNNTMSDIASEMTNSVDKDGQTVLTGIIDHNGNNIVLDTDGDTLLDLGTDDQVGITIAGAEDFLFLANIFRALSGSVIETNTINETTAASGVTIDGVVLKDSGITAGGDILSDTDSTDSIGSNAVRWLKGWFDTLTAGTLTIGSGSITDSSGAITFGNENLSTTGTAATGALTVTGAASVSGDTTMVGKLIVNRGIMGGTAGDTLETFALQGILGNALNFAGTNRSHTTGTSWTTTNFRLQRTVDVTPHGFIDFGVDGVASSEGLGFGTGTTTYMNIDNAGNLGVSGDITTSARLILGGESELTIATGVITITGSIHMVDTEGDASTDDLDTISGFADGGLLVLRAIDDTHTVVLKDGTGNLLLAGDFSLTHRADSIILGFTAALNQWYEISRSDNNT